MPSTWTAERRPAAQAEAAIAAGVHVFLEKPATPTADEFAPRRGGPGLCVVFEGMRNAYDRA
jgi:hypothetical protein